MSQKAGVGLVSDVDGVPIEFVVSASGTMKLKKVQVVGDGKILLS